MEIVFNNLSYVYKKNIIFNKINLSINSGTITAFLGDNISYLNDLFSINKRPTSGFIKFNDLKFTRTRHINNINEYQKKIAVIINKNEYFFDCQSVKDEIKDTLLKNKHNVDNINKHIEQSIKIAGLDIDILDRNPNELSYTEQKRVLLASKLSYNPDIIILNDFDEGFNYRDKEYFKKLFLKLKNKYNKNIIILTKKIDFLINLVDNVYIIKKGEIAVSGDKNIFYNDELYKYVEIPKIVEFTKYTRSKNYKIIKYLDRNELIKEIYRYIKF